MGATGPRLRETDKVLLKQAEIHRPDAEPRGHDQAAVETHKRVLLPFQEPIIPHERLHDPIHPTIRVRESPLKVRIQQPIRQDPHESVLIVGHLLHPTVPHHVWRVAAELRQAGQVFQEVGEREGAVQGGADLCAGVDGEELDA